MWMWQYCSYLDEPQQTFYEQLSWNKWDQYPGRMRVKYVKIIIY